ncbi:LacI family transcriptional regulator [Glaciihabitans tibetensis]|uniref:LacI family transcriptional regulator n=1 Tax=Glaciihabitans tibetensis TaxID=1266600 RepID=A0A2T0VAH7_9MICO|nr:LacI family DNA-binding transcriptional regulator [Glaciihabitans tibetensis]PRY67047.1 LacI family transcriptional regulator [Glaciihabitans tibetensis]
MPGIDEVARLAGVSTATVSRALNGKLSVSGPTRDRVLAAASRLGYVVSSNASGLATGRTKNVGVVIPFLNRWFYSSVIEGAESALLQRGYDLTLYNLSGGGEERRSVFEHFLLRKRVDAVIAISLELTPSEVSRMLAMNTPIVGIGGPLPGVRTLSVDDVEVARRCTQYLIDLGHHSIAHIGGSQESERDFHLPTSRRVGYEAALADAGIPIDPSLFEAGSFTIESGHRAAMRLLSQPHRPTAIFAASDEMAIGAILAVRELGLAVPGDVSVIGIDDHELASFFGLTTIAQFPQEQGRRAVEMLMEELHPGTGDTLALNVPLPVELVVRQSTARRG